MLIRVSCLEFPPFIDRLILSENKSSPPRKYSKDRKLKFIVDEAKIPITNRHSIIYFHQTPAFLFNLLISGSDTSELESSACRSLPGIALLNLPILVCEIILAPPRLKSSNTN